MPLSTSPCPFCTLPTERVWFETDAALAFLDSYPISVGHSLVIPKRHIESIFDLPESEFQQLWMLVLKVRLFLVEMHHLDAFNVGVNDGASAGQTVTHAHIHVIPRSSGDVADPRGGIRWIIPEKAKYW